MKRKLKKRTPNKIETAMLWNQERRALLARSILADYDSMNDILERFENRYSWPSQRDWWLSSKGPLNDKRRRRSVA